MTLLADGPSDISLRPILLWLWTQTHPDDLVDFMIADLSSTRITSRKITDRLPVALDLFPCDILFIHRDAEKEPAQNRYDEINQAISALPPEIARPSFVAIVPVRMSEAWMLSSEIALRKAAGNPNGKNPLELPVARKIESVPDPKRLLHQLLTESCGLPGQRKSKFNAAKASLLVTGHTAEFSALRQLPSFQRLEQDLRQIP
jgi:hypothetical protein